MNEVDDEIVGREPVESSKIRIIFKDGDPLVIKISTWVDLGLKIGLHVDHVLRGQLEEYAQIDAATDLALRHLRFRTRSRFEVVTYLLRHEVPEAIADKVTGRLTQQGLLDDARYARDLVEVKQGSLSRREMAQRLSRLGLQMPPKEDIGVKAADEAEWLAASNAARKHWKSHAKDDLRKRRNKLTGYLQRRGFPTSVIRRVVEEIASEPLPDELFGWDNDDV